MGSRPKSVIEGYRCSFIIFRRVFLLVARVLFLLAARVLYIVNIPLELIKQKHNCFRLP
jgi:hypothetical protein